MAESEDPTGIAELATEAVAPIEEELRQRLVVAVDEQDQLAIETALLKAFINGMRAGAGEATERAMNQTGPPNSLGGRPPISAAQLDPPLPWMDPWAEKYGSSGS
jgi:hypothetical protein